MASHIGPKPDFRSRPKRAKGQSVDRYLLVRFASHWVGRPELSMPSGPPQ
jgi:hypothetical protein